MTHHIHADHHKALIELLLTGKRCLLLLGPPGIGKTTLAATLAQRLSKVGKTVRCLSADPGLPAFGLPGAINLGVWQQGVWRTEAYQALCSLDAARFRLPLIEAVGRLANSVKHGILLIDSPGVVRGVAGSELLTSIVAAAGVDQIAVLQREGQQLPLQQELLAVAAETLKVAASPLARRPGKNTRNRERTRLWDSHLEHATVREIDLRTVKRLGTPPRLAPEAWRGKQIAFLEGEACVAMGEVVAMTGETLQLKLPPEDKPTSLLLVRDAARDSSGQLVTSKRFAESVVRYLPPSDLVPDFPTVQEGGYRPMVQTGSASALLMNGVFGDPQLHLRLAHQRRSLLFDLGDGARLPGRVAHQVSDVFISHAHMDHICGFLWLLRARIGEQQCCRLYGPPGLATQIEHLINGIHWDRIGDRGPSFEVSELHGERLIRIRLQAGKPGRQPLDEIRVKDGIVLEEAQFSIRAITLDHGIPVLAYAFEPVLQVNVRKERLCQRGLEPGPWLTELKQCIAAQRLDHRIELPNGSVDRVRELAISLTLISPSSKIVYATDLADTQKNREGLNVLAKQAHTLFCESPFMQKDAVQAQRTGHLTTTACAEIASRAQVRHLIPFHFSRRYEDAPLQVYDEIAMGCPQLVRPSGSKGCGYLPIT
jgi:ribonuclease BN (tRNA processing enzyme)/polynucleotide 5'-kinase involved in rRNA processing